MKKIIVVLLLISSFSMPAQSSKTITLFSSKKSDYKIVLEDRESAYERRALEIIQNYLGKVSGVDFNQNASPKFRITVRNQENTRSADSFSIKNEGENIIIEGNKQGLIYGAYTFVEKVLGCRKYNPGEEPFCPSLNELTIPLPLKIEEKPHFSFREVYSLAETDQQYMEWHKLQNLEELWGIWGHSFHQLVPVAYFDKHPEYFAYYNGKRNPTQLCLHNKEVFNIAVKTLEEAFSKNPNALYWSISPNDDAGFCECRFCRAANLKDGGQQGSVLKFVNKIAARFPDKTFTTLAYTHTSNPPLVTVPKKNVIIFLSNIEIYRTFEVEKDASAELFRKKLMGWKNKTDTVFIWDYYTQFTNFLAPFPNYFTFRPNIKYYRKNNIRGVFAQLNGPTYGDFAELKTYLLAKYLWKPDLNEQHLMDDFLEGYYKNAAPYIKSYLEKLNTWSIESGINLDIYGNPVNSHDDYLTPENMEALSIIMDDAQKAAESDSLVFQRIQKLRLSLDYTYLQQAKFYGIEKHGIFIKEDSGWIVKPGFRERVSRFVDFAEKSNVKELSEGGSTPAQYWEEWQRIFESGVKDNLPLNTEIHLKHPFLEDYPAKKEKTLIDGNPGYDDFSFNWLCFYDKPMIATLDFGKQIPVKEVEMNFLEDLRHWIIRPKSVKIEFSTDGVTYKTLGRQQLGLSDESDTPKKVNAAFRTLNIEAQYLRITAENQSKMPGSAYTKFRKPMLACDEIWVK
ncbi:MAG: DUF4838 domain-containing protein [Kaistella sp.]